MRLPVCASILGTAAGYQITLGCSSAKKLMPNAWQASSVYLEKEIIPSMRSMIQKAQAPPRGKKGAPAQPPPKVCVG